MTETNLNDEGWPAKKWLALLGVILALQVVFFLWLSPRNKQAPPLPHAPEAATVYLPSPASVENSLVIAPEGGALPRLSGFSGDAWLKFTNPGYVSPAFAEPALDLAISADKLGNALVEGLSRNGASGLEGISQWEHPATPVLPVDFGTPPKSWLEVGGGLLRWASNSIPDLHCQPSGEILGSTVVLAGVDEHGLVFSATLLAKSGSAAADAEALALARSARFFSDPFASPENLRGDDSMHWGRLIFHWLTVAPEQTNSSGDTNVVVFRTGPKE